MPNTHSTLTSLFTDIANAIRAKKGSSSPITADNFPTEIASIPSGVLPYLCFEAEDTTNIAFIKNGSLPLIYLEYSKDKINWHEYVLGQAISLEAGEKCYFKGNNNNFNKDDSNFYQFTSTGLVKASGSVMSLLDETCENKVINIPYCFNNLFSYCTNLIQAPELPATTLAEYCYSEMFYGCTSLTKPTELPATQMVDGCYNKMFKNCSNIKLSATKTGNYKIAYRIPKEGTGHDSYMDGGMQVFVSDHVNQMFTGTGGTFTGTPSINTTYYMAVPEEVYVESISITSNGTYTAPSGSAYSPITVLVTIDAYAGEVVDSETWLLNSTLTGSLTGASINFTSNSNDYINLRCEATTSSTILYYSSKRDVTAVYTNSSGWANQAYRTITFEGSPTGTLLTWLQRNGVKQ